MDDFEEIKEDSDLISNLKDALADESSQFDYTIEDIPPVTKSHYMNELFAIGKMAKEGKININIFRNKLNSEIIRFYEIYRNFLNIFGQNTLPEEIIDQARDVFESLQKYEKALEELVSYFDNEDPEIIESGLNNAVSSINKLTLAYEDFIKGQSDALTKKCDQCGHPNPIGIIICNSCDSNFVLKDEEIPIEFTNLRFNGPNLSLFFGAAPIPGSLIELYDNFLRFSGKTLTKDKFLENTDWMITQLKLARQKLEREIYNADSESIESKQFLFDGIEILQKALDKLSNKIALDQMSDFSSQWGKILLAIQTIIKSQQKKV